MFKKIIFQAFKGYFLGGEGGGRECINRNLDKKRRGSQSLFQVRPPILSDHNPSGPIQIRHIHTRAGAHTQPITKLLTAPLSLTASLPVACSLGTTVSEVRTY